MRAVKRANDLPVQATMIATAAQVSADVLDDLNIEAISDAVQRLLASKVGVA
jgi:hypothetical protein